MNNNYSRLFLQHVFTAAVICMMAACNNPSGDQNASNGKPGQHKKVERPIIEKENAYSSLFTDSNAVEKFIRQQKIEGTVAENIRNFYGYRDHQYA